MKVCIECGQDKPLTEFRKRKTKKGFSYSGKCWRCLGKKKRAKQEAIAKDESRECRRIKRNRGYVPDGFKYCWKCGQLKPLAGFHDRKSQKHNHKDGKQSECKACREAMRKERKPSVYIGILRRDWWMYKQGYYCKKHTPTLYCAECGEWFKPSHKSQTICSDECVRIRDNKRSALYHKANPWMMRARKYSRKLREYKQNDGSCTVHAFKLLYESRDTCLYCEATLTRDNITLDHMEPLSLGGLHGVSNLVPCCTECNDEKRAKPFYEWLARFKQADQFRIIKVYRQVRNRGTSI